MEMPVDAASLASIMRRGVTTVTPETSVRQVAVLMSGENIGSVPVIEAGRPVGIITERDFLREVGRCGDFLCDKLARDIMTTPVLTHPESTSLREALEFLRERRIRRAVVVDADGRLTGLATQTDILRALSAVLVAGMRDEELVGIAAHDLKSPLTPILAAAKLLRDEEFGTVTAEQRETLDMIVRSGEAMLAIVKDLLEITSLNAGGIRLKPRNFSLRELLERSLGPHTARAKEKGISLTCTRPEAEASAHGDPERLAEVLDNLVGNALKFTPPGGAVEVEARVDDALILRVRDTGPGIAMAERDAIFKRFAKGAARPTQGESSTGLGLSIVKLLVELHGGTIGLESTLGEGSTFTVRIPPPGAGL
ncbi:MAG: CBS domain-containing protein [Elusimicrobiota bacterium]